MPKKPDPIVDFEPPSQETFDLLFRAMRTYFSPVIYGMDDIDTTVPHLFVGNHSVYGVFDAQLMAAELYRSKGIFLRGLYDHFQESIPLWRDVLKWEGGVDGTRENVRKLMKAGESILLFPGGAREVTKRKGEAYKLIWKKRLGFVRLAVEHSYSILPFASVGGDHALSILYDANDMMNSFLGKSLKRTGILKDTSLKDGELLSPLVRGIGLTPIPRPERLYFSFGEPIDTAPFKGKHKDEEVLFEVRQRVEDSVTRQIQELLHRREQDKDVGILRRFLNRL